MFSATRKSRAKTGRLVTVGLALLATSSLVACSSSTDAGADGPSPVTIRAILPLVPEALEMQGFHAFVDTLEEDAPWVTVDVIGSAEVVPGTDQAEALSNGAFDMAPIFPGYIEGFIPGGPALLMSPNTPTEERESGGLDVINEVVFNPHGLTVIGETMAEMQQTLWLGQEAGDAMDPENPSLQGRLIRGGSQYKAAVAYLGGEMVNMPIGEVYTSMDRGVIDGLGAGSAGMDALGVTDVVAYEVQPYFKRNTEYLTVNTAWWDGLEDETRDAINDAMISSDEKIENLYKDLLAADEKKRRDDGIVVIEFAPDVAEAYADEINERSWEEALALNPKLQKLRDHWGL